MQELTCLVNVASKAYTHSDMMRWDHVPTRQQQLRHTSLEFYRVPMPQESMRHTMLVLM